MAVQTINYQCPACTAPLRFDGTSGKLVCDYCESSYSVEEVEAFYREKTKKAEEASAKEEKKEKEIENERIISPVQDEWNEESLSGDWGVDSEKLKAYSCTSCGAELICDDTTAATTCPYCGNPTVIPGQFAGALKPDYVIPFKIDKKQAVNALKMHYGKKKLLPKAFKDENHIQEIKGVYVPFWLFDGKAQVEMNAAAMRTHQFKEGKYMVTVTEHYDLYRKGQVSFEKIPVDASSRMPDDFMDSIEPFDYAELKEFSMAYFAGFFADKYDVSVADSKSRADLRTENTAVEAVQNTLKHPGAVIRNRHVHLQRGDVHYALLPVWMLTTNWNGKRYMFAMNGQTGKLVVDEAGLLTEDELNQKKWFKEKYKEEHKSELNRYYRARRVLQENRNDDGKVPVHKWEYDKSVLPGEIAALKEEKDALFRELKTYQKIQKNIESVLDDKNESSVLEALEKKQVEVKQREAVKPKKRNRGMEL